MEKLFPIVWIIFIYVHKCLCFNMEFPRFFLKSLLNVSAVNVLKTGFFTAHSARKVSKYGVFSGPYFPAFELTTERYGVSLRIQSKCGKIQTRKKLRIWTLFTQFKSSPLSYWCFSLCVS